MKYKTWRKKKFFFFLSNKVIPSRNFWYVFLPWSPHIPTESNDYLFPVWQMSLVKGKTESWICSTMYDKNNSELWNSKSIWPWSLTYVIHVVQDPREIMGVAFRRIRYKIDRCRDWSYGIFWKYKRCFITSAITFHTISNSEKVRWYDE